MYLEQAVEQPGLEVKSPNCSSLSANGTSLNKGSHANFVSKINKNIFLLEEKEKRNSYMIEADQTFFLVGVIYAVSGHIGFLSQ